MRVKICGITTVEDGLAAVEAGADAVGLNFVGGPRKIGLETGQGILEALPPFVTPVALVSLRGGAIPDDLLELLGQYWVSHVQVYGDVTSEALAILRRDGFQTVPVVGVRDAEFARQALEVLGERPAEIAAAVVLDAQEPGLQGGTGRAFNWQWVAAARDSATLDAWPPIILAGGLGPENVAEAVRIVRPFGVDVSSGVEKAGMPGRKDPERMRAFVRAARGALG